MFTLAFDIPENKKKVHLITYSFYEFEVIVIYLLKLMNN